MPHCACGRTTASGQRMSSGIMTARDQAAAFQVPGFRAQAVRSRQESGRKPVPHGASVQVQLDNSRGETILAPGREPGIGECAALLDCF